MRFAEGCGRRRESTCEKGGLGTPDPTAGQQLSHRLRLVRRQQGLSLSALAAKTGLTKGFLSQVERDKKTPSISTLLRIAHVLGVGVASLLEHSTWPDAEFSLVRRGQRKSVRRKGSSDGSYEAIAFRKKVKRMEPFIVSPPRVPRELFHHDGEEMIYVLSGRIGFYLRDKYVVLDPGDCMYFDASAAHRSHSVGKRRAKALVVVTTPPGASQLWPDLAMAGQHTRTKRQLDHKRSL